MAKAKLQEIADRQLLLLIASRLTGISDDDLTTAEFHITRLLMTSSILEIRKGSVEMKKASKKGARR